MHAPQLILLTLLAIGLGIAMAEHGQPKKGKENAGLTLVAVLLQLGLLYWGGFFSN